MTPPRPMLKRRLRPMVAEPAFGLLIVTALALVLLIGLVVWLGRGAETRLNRQEQLSCQRLNITRSTDNQAHLNTYLLYKFVIKRFLIVTPTETAAQKQITEQFQAVLRIGLRESNWSPLVNCTVPRSAVTSVDLRPVRFSDQMPPQSALSSLNAARLDPIGSVS